MFIPVARLLQSEMILPSDNYRDARIQQLRKDAEDQIDAILPPLFERMLPAMKEALVNEVVEEGGELSAVIGLKIARTLQEDYEIKPKI